MERFYYNMFVMLMSLFMCMSGVLLTALAYRPKEIAEEWWEWTERFYKSGFSFINFVKSCLCFGEIGRAHV